MLSRDRAFVLSDPVKNEQFDLLFESVIVRVGRNVQMQVSIADMLTKLAELKC